MTELHLVPKLPMKVWVYFVQDSLGFVKIGKSCNPRLRLKELQVAHATKLEFLCMLDDVDEAVMHSQFAGERVSGEWFYPSEVLKGFLKERAGVTLEPKNNWSMACTASELLQRALKFESSTDLLDKSPTDILDECREYCEIQKSFAEALRVANETFDQCTADVINRVTAKLNARVRLLNGG